MSEFFAMACHIAVMYLHIALVWRINKQDNKDSFARLFVWLMLLCLALHSTYSLYFAALLFDWQQVLSPTVNSGYIILAFLPPFLLALFLTELKPPQNQQGYLVRVLTNITGQSFKTTNNITGQPFKILAYGMGISIVITTPDMFHFFVLDKTAISFGNLYALGYVIVFFLIWTIMQMLGFRTESELQGQPPARMGYLLTLLIMVVLSVISVFVDLGHAWSAIPIVASVGLALSYSWYRLKLTFLDVTVNQFLIVLFALATTMVLFQLLDSRLFRQSDTQQRLLLTLATLTCLSLLALCLYRWFNSFWQPATKELQKIHQLLPLQLATCANKQQAIQQTEQFLKTLFHADLKVSTERIPLQTANEVITLTGTPPIHLQLKAIKDWMPWFSTAINWALTAGQYLQNHLQLLANIEEQQGLIKKQHTLEQQKEKLAALKSKAELTALRAQIRPHFLFNTLNSIHSFVSIAPEKAEKTIELLADLLRYILKMSEHDLVPIKHEMRVVENYLEIEKLRYTKQLSIKIDLEESLYSLMLPSFSIQPLIENAIKHGVDKQLTPVQISVFGYTKEQYAIIEVTDNGPGLLENGALSENKSKTGLGMALNNIQSRLQSLYGKEADLTLSNKREGQGAVAKLVFPITKMNSGANSRE